MIKRSNSFDCQVAAISGGASLSDLLIFNMHRKEDTNSKIVSYIRTCYDPDHPYTISSLLELGESVKINDWQLQHWDIILK